MPREFKVFFNRFRDLFTRRQVFYFSTYIYGLLVMPKEKKNVSQIAEASIEWVCRSSLEKFLCEARWEFEKVIQRARTQVIRHLSHLPKAKRRIELVIDDTDIEKFGESIFGVGWYKRYQEEQPWRAIQMVVLGVLIDDWFVPLDFRIYAPKNICKYIPMRFETKLDMAAKMIKKLKLPREFSADVLFDSWYLSPQVTQAVEQKVYCFSWKWYSRCRSNRKVRWE